MNGNNEQPRINEEHYSIEMADFDELPENVRKLLNYVPLKMSASITRVVVEKHQMNTKEVAARMEEQLVNAGLFPPKLFSKILLDNNILI